ncbi:MAG: SAM-dependent methyltransferase, partial [Burkholderiaceae bacterium]
MNVRTSLPQLNAAQIEHSRRVTSHVAAEIERAGGWIPFDRYMELVLYAPGLGYYAAGARKLGDSSVGGDFVTAPEMSPIFADALAAQLQQLFEQVPSCIVEFGAGSGALARDLIAALEERSVALESYSIIEVSLDLADRQRERLQRLPVGWL